MNNRYREEENLEQTEETTTVEPEVMSKDEMNDLKKLQEDNKNLQEELKKSRDQYLRVLADAENFRKRIDEERIRDRKYGSQKLLEKLVEAIDIFDKAVNFNTDDSKLKNFLIGFEMINNQLKNILADEGVRKITSLNQKFDPNVHHAIDTAYQEDRDDDIIVEEYKSGYMYKDRVLRAASVKVNKKIKEEIKQ